LQLSSQHLPAIGRLMRMKTYMHLLKLYRPVANLIIQPDWI